MVTQTDKEHTYVHFENTDSATGKEGYELLRLGIASGKDSEQFDFVFFMAKVRSFASAVEAGELKGTIKRDLDGKPKTVKLTSSSADIEKWLQAQHNEPFVLSQVSVARKVKKTD